MNLPNTNHMEHSHTIAATLIARSNPRINPVPHYYWGCKRYYANVCCYIDVHVTRESPVIKEGFTHCGKCAAIFATVMPPMDNFLQRDKFIRGAFVSSSSGSCLVCYKEKRCAETVCWICGECVGRHDQERQRLVSVWLLCGELVGVDVGRLVGMLVAVVG
jgi:hypothetical protein